MEFLGYLLEVYFIIYYKMEITKKEGCYTEERVLIIKANSFNDGILIDKWHNQITEHLSKLDLKAK